MADQNYSVLPPPEYQQQVYSNQTPPATYPQQPQYNGYSQQPYIQQQNNTQQQYPPQPSYYQQTPQYVQPTVNQPLMMAQPTYCQTPSGVDEKRATNLVFLMFGLGFLLLFPWLVAFIISRKTKNKAVNVVGWISFGLFATCFILLTLIPVFVTL
ncbi:hypothetical protein EIN_275970 [Entamoeba invadens IP1]|uniref:Uncharacterized protein n=1 Tax=Entamoeba invadens IP1 TaxID=370355 RepID=A0A0A1UBF6_ENTIV|nr:hypothetical protein EIN_275970 [Entamoeba invadens IP1]ELP92518.1 hypothetical protein EIN_275970 [Entamoeba invadens IP1]|eukprot:XP_004259289.1 hypothetical protein EIN_275970 [Entamoeba invadens IP1]